MIKIYCDGSAKANGQKDNCGGAGVCALVFDNPENDLDFRIDKYWNKQYTNTTNNQMELIALMEAIDLATTRYKDEKCIIYSDSAYCVNICRDWIWNWAKNDWKNSKNQIIENLGLVQGLYCRLIIDNFANYTIEKIPGHCNIVGNEFADALARNDQAKIDKFLYQYHPLYRKIKDFDLQ